MNGKDMPLEFRMYVPDVLMELANIPMPKGVGPSTIYEDLVCPTHLPMPSVLPPYPVVPSTWNTNGSYGLTINELAKMPWVKEEMASLSVWLQADTLDNHSLPPVVGPSQDAYKKVTPQRPTLPWNMQMFYNSTHTQATQPNTLKQYLMKSLLPPSPPPTPLPRWYANSLASAPTSSMCPRRPCPLRPSPTKAI